MLIFPLKKQWYKKYLSGEKTTEYRLVKRYWTIRLRTLILNKMNEENGNTYYLIKFNLGRKVENLNIPCILQLGYTNRRMEAKIDSIEIVNGSQTDLHTNQLVYAIKLKDVRECE